jgi:hypothetical protein
MPATFAACLTRSPENAITEKVRRFQLHPREHCVRE